MDEVKLGLIILICGVVVAVAGYRINAKPGRQAVYAFHQWERDVKGGGSGVGYWRYRDEAEHFFAVRSCNVLSVYPSRIDKEHADIVARIESSNQGGLPLVSDWIVAMEKTSDGWKIDSMVQR